jgi:hypothetical protein
MFALTCKSCINLFLVQFVGEAGKVVLQFLDGLVAKCEQGQTEGEISPLPGLGGRPEAMAKLLYQRFQVFVLLDETDYISAKRSN